MSRKGRGGGAAYQLPVGFALTAGYLHTSFEDSDAGAMTSLRAGAAYDAGSLGEPAGRVSWCPVAGVTRERLGDLTILTVPVGVAAGVSLPLSDAWDAVLHLEPRVVYTRAEVAGFADAERSPGVRGGASLSHGRLFLGGSFEWVKAERANRSGTLEIGVRLGGGR